MSTTNNNKYNVKLGPAWSLVGAVENIVDGEGHQGLVDDALKKIALDAANISETTALHEMLYRIAYWDYYLMTYDDLDWIVDDDEAVEYFAYLALHMGIELRRKYKTVDGIRNAIGRQNFEKGLHKIVDSAFAILWQHKEILYKFNALLAEEIKQCKKNDFPDNFEKDGVLKRVPFPTWLKKQIVYRDRGYCQHCGKQVESVDLVDGSYDLDHMIPLNKGGTNDPTNLILSCVHCNRSKRANYKPINDFFTWPERKCD